MSKLKFTLVIATAAMLLAPPFSSGHSEVAAREPDLGLSNKFPLEWVRFSDPAEHAFVFDVPRNWRAEGGIRRVSALQPIPWLRVRSSDEKTLVVFGDPNMVAFATPSQISVGLNWPEGTVYNAGGVYLTIMKYRPGEVFAAEYGSRNLPSLCSNVHLESSIARPDLSSALTSLFGQVRVAAGEARFTCMLKGEPMEAYLFSAPVLYADQQGLGIWEGNRLYGFLATRDLAPAASVLTAHMLKSFEFDLGWLRRQSDIAVSVSRTSTAVNAQISKTIMQSWENRQAGLDRGFDEYSRMQRGIDIYANPATGTRVTVKAGSAYYWINGRGEVQGTATDQAPGPDFVRMTRVPSGG